MRHGVVRIDINDPFEKLLRLSHTALSVIAKTQKPFREAEVLGAIGRGGKASSSLVECSLGLELSRPPVVYQREPRKEPWHIGFSNEDEDAFATFDAGGAPPSGPTA